MNSYNIKFKKYYFSKSMKFQKFFWKFFLSFWRDRRFIKAQIPQSTHTVMTATVATEYCIVFNSVFSKMNSFRKFLYKSGLLGMTFLFVKIIVLSNFFYITFTKPLTPTSYLTPTFVPISSLTNSVSFTFITLKPPPFTKNSTFWSLQHKPVQKQQRLYQNL